MKLKKNYNIALNIKEIKFNFKTLYPNKTCRYFPFIMYIRHFCKTAKSLKIKYKITCT